jgi:hypothetical protein
MNKTHDLLVKKILSYNIKSYIKIILVYNVRLKKKYVFERIYFI